MSRLETTRKCGGVGDGIGGEAVAVRVEIAADIIGIALTRGEIRRA